MADQATPGVPPGRKQWFEPIRTDETWWNGLDNVVKRILSTTGEVECLKDPIEDFTKTRLTPNVSQLKWLVDKKGTHEDFLWDFAVGEGGRGQTYWEIVAWLAECFKD